MRDKGRRHCPHCHRNGQMLRGYGCLGMAAPIGYSLEQETRWLVSRRTSPTPQQDLNKYHDDTP